LRIALIATEPEIEVAGDQRRRRHAAARLHQLGFDAVRGEIALVDGEEKRRVIGRGLDIIDLDVIERACRRRIRRCKNTHPHGRNGPAFHSSSSLRADGAR
jgi:hypothetical protein